MSQSETSALALYRVDVVERRTMESDAGGG
jgi:hypothetical protein